MKSEEEKLRLKEYQKKWRDAHPNIHLKYANNKKELEQKLANVELQLKEAQQLTEIWKFSYQSLIKTLKGEIL